MLVLRQLIHEVIRMCDGLISSVVRADAAAEVAVTQCAPGMPPRPEVLAERTRAR
jgi:hypothetical protein